MESVQKKQSKTVIFGILITAILFVMPSIVYYVKYKSIINYKGGWTHLLESTFNLNETISLILFLVLFIAFLIFYFKILKNEQKIFKNNKQIWLLIVVISILFMLIVPYISKDIFAYIANGWIGANYNENPYYISVGEVKEKYNASQDEMFEKVAPVWTYERVTYGPLSTMFVTILSYISFGNLNVALWIFKIANLLIHLGSAVIIYKITKKRKFLLMYALNPVILLEALTDAHNDLWLVFLLLVALYFTCKKKNLLLTTIMVALATAVKYVAILILPFLVIYLLKEKNLKGRIIGCIKAAIIFIVTIVICYFPYIKDLNVLAGLFLQQRKI